MTSCPRNGVKAHLCLYGLNNDVPVGQIAAATDLTEEQVQRVFRDIEQKRKTTEYLHLQPALVRPVEEIATHQVRPGGMRYS